MNVLAGYGGNHATGIAVGATISGGGVAGWSNSVSGSYGTVGGGRDNTAAVNATVGGGLSNSASGGRATVGGGNGNTASGELATVGGGGRQRRQRQRRHRRRGEQQHRQRRGCHRPWRNVQQGRRAVQLRRRLPSEGRPPRLLCLGRLHRRRLHLPPQQPVPHPRQRRRRLRGQRRLARHLGHRRQGHPHLHRRHPDDRWLVDGQL